MRIILDNSGYEPRNFGDIAMLQATISRILSVRRQTKLDRWRPDLRDSSAHQV